MIGTSDTTNLAEYKKLTGSGWDWSDSGTWMNMHMADDSDKLGYRFNYNNLQDPKWYNCDVLGTYQWVNKHLIEHRLTPNT